MPRMTPAYAKNTIRRALHAVVDPEPSASEVAALWEFFGAKCAYCGQALSKADRNGHIDHLIPTTGGGTNAITNRVLSCAPCNGDEKREDDWLTFLRKKSNNDPGIFESRRRQIDIWRARPVTSRQAIDSEKLDQEIDRALTAFDLAVNNLRAARNSPS
jgi:5-methylcytosine-specific restriction endonuclease McrA